MCIVQSPVDQGFLVESYTLEYFSKTMSESFLLCFINV